MFGDLERTPRTLLVCDRSSFLDEKNRLSSQVEQLHFNYKVSMLLPECSSAPSRLEAVLNSFNSFYLIRKLPIHELLDKHFLETSVHQGLVSGLSYRTRIDEDNCVALMPNGHLSLSLDKDSFELLGVEGKPSRYNLGTNSRYGGGASLQALLSRCDWSEHRPEVRSYALTDLCCPLLTSDLQSRDPHLLLEWLGAVDADVSCENSSNSFLSTLVCPEPKTTMSRALSVSVCGLLSPQDVHRLIQQIRCYLDQPRLESWASLTVHGFVDSPVSWGGDEHGVLRGGENFYSLLMFHDHTYHLHLGTGAHDTCPP
ncbi:ribonuclease P protein subunit p40 isoform X4 [Cebidichthys violaceus]|uniref:ribonuclease P protein subunit p40 isoform X4 n=1 Tax=Cebidichthys violaceus TaxID=271503 RepID=UPI0035CC0585